MLTVYLGNKYIRAVEGNMSGNRLRIRQAYETVDNKGTIINGAIVDEAALSELISDLWEAYKLPKKEVNLVLDSTQFHTRNMQVPQMSNSKKLEYIKREFTGMENVDSLVHGYFRIKKLQKGKMDLVTAMATPRDYAVQFMTLFKKLGIQLTGIESVNASMNRMIDMLSQIKNKTCIIQFVEDMNLTSILYYNGNIETSSRKRLFAEAGTPGYVVEAARAVTNVIQFAKTQNIDEYITHVFVAGITGGDLEIYEDSIRNINPDFVTEPLTGGDRIVIDKGGNDELFSKNALAIGGLIKADDGINIISRIKYTEEELEARKKRKRLIVPAAAVCGILAVISIVLFGRNMYLSHKLKLLTDYNNDPQIIKTCAEYDVLNANINAAQGITDGLKGLTDMLRTYPVVNSDTENIVTQCAEGLVTANISGYDAGNGVLSLQAKAGNVEQINKFIDRLTMQEVFASVDYTGYAQDREGTWSLNVSCVMAPGEVPEATEEPVSQDTEVSGAETAQPQGEGAAN